MGERVRESECVDVSGQVGAPPPSPITRTPPHHRTHTNTFAHSRTHIRTHIRTHTHTHTNNYTHTVAMWWRGGVRVMGRGHGTARQRTAIAGAVSCFRNTRPGATLLLPLLLPVPLPLAVLHVSPSCFFLIPSVCVFWSSVSAAPAPVMFSLPSMPPVPSLRVSWHLLLFVGVSVVPASGAPPSVFVGGWSVLSSSAFSSNLNSAGLSQVVTLVLRFQ